MSWYFRGLQVCDVYLVNSKFILFFLTQWGEKTSKGRKILKYSVIWKSGIQHQHSHYTVKYNEVASTLRGQDTNKGSQETAKRSGDYSFKREKYIKMHFFGKGGGPIYREMEPVCQLQRLRINVLHIYLPDLAANHLQYQAESHIQFPVTIKKSLPAAVESWETETQLRMNPLPVLRLFVILLWSVDNKNTVRYSSIDMAGEQEGM